MSRPKRSTLALTVFAALAMGASSCSRKPSSTAANHLLVSANFECLWWNASQMEAMDPNHPPSKTTRVKIERWEYTDPVGSLHPDVVDVAVRAENASDQEVDDVAWDVEIQWSEGAMARKESAVWGKSEQLPAPGPTHLAARGIVQFRVPINLASRMTALAATQRWPWSVRAVVTARVSGIVLGSTRIELPIFPAD